MPKSSRGWAQRLLTCAILALLLVEFSAVPASATLAPTPYMGWNTYYGVGGIYNEQTIVSVANSLGSRGLAQAGGDVWVKPLAGGDRAVALLNRGTSALEISTTAAAVGVLSAGQYALQDLWTGDTSTTTGPISALVPPQSAVLYRVSPLGGEVAISAPSSVAPSSV
jgi:Alpha galactosidase C-terminal beta sandwich domain